MKSRTLIALALGLFALAACKGKSGYELSKADTVSTNTGDSSSTAKKLVKTADMNFRVKSVQQTSEAISSLASEYQGMVMHHQVQSTIENTKDVPVSDDSLMRVSTYNVVGDMTIKIPSEYLEIFMNQVGKMSAYLNSRKMDVEDRTMDYLSENLKIKNRNEVLQAQQKGTLVSKDTLQVLSTKDDVVDRKISNLRTNDAVKYSVVTLSFNQTTSVQKEKVANNDLSAYSLSTLTRLWMAVESGWQLFMELIIVLTNLWVFILAGVGAWAIYYKTYRKRKLNVNLPNI